LASEGCDVLNAKFVSIFCKVTGPVRRRRILQQSLRKRRKVRYKNLKKSKEIL